jgi:pimeloyl-ACP methyl ester carboxylesterase
MPDMPASLENYRSLPLGRMRSRTVGRGGEGVPEVVVVMGMAVADYLMPAVAALGAWTRAHLVELPGFAGSGDPPHELSVAEHGEAVAGWLDATELGPVALVGHSSGTQVAAHAAARRPERVCALVLASPTVDPVARSWLRLFVRWRLDGRREPPGLTESHRREWRRAGARRLLHLVRTHLHDDIETTLGDVRAPALVLRGRDDRLLTRGWAQRLAEGTPAGRLLELPGAHTFPWLDPQAWSAPLQHFVMGDGDVICAPRRSGP